MTINIRRSNFFALASVMAVTFMYANFASVAQADITYSSENFEGGTVADSVAAFNGTDYTHTANSANKAGIAANRTSSGGPGAGSDPTGQHALVRGDNNKHFTLTNPMTLLTDGVTSLEIDLAVFFNNTGNSNRLRLQYSESGLFDDTDQIQVFNPTGTADLPNFEYDDDKWYAGQSVTIDSSDVNFSDTAKLRWSKQGTGQGNRVWLDDIVITGIAPASEVVPEPASIAIWSVLGLCLAGYGYRRRRNS